MKAIIARVIDECGIRRNPYFEALRDGSFDRRDFVETQIQFFDAVTFFSRPMAALAARIPTPAQRMEILRNVWEEHGDGQVYLSHTATFLEFLKRLDGLEQRDLDTRASWPEVRIFNTCLAGSCTLDDPRVGCALLGVIELMFSDISGWIGRAVVERGWLEPSTLVHYKVHEELDVRHASDFFNVVEADWTAGGDGRYFVEQGLWMGATLFSDLYAGLYRGRQRRIMAERERP